MSEWDRELALPANVTRDMAGAGRGRPEVGAGSDAALAHHDHDGAICTNRARGAAKGAGATH